MTEPQDDFPISTTLDALEPAARTAFGRAPDLAAISQAISLRRIADALEKLATPRALDLGKVVGLDLTDPVTVQATRLWHDWSGGKCPTDSLALVDVRFRDGREGLGTAGNWMWKHSLPRTSFQKPDHPADIVAWRLAK